MKLSGAINRLTSLLRTHGDLEVTYNDGNCKRAIQRVDVYDEDENMADETKKEGAEAFII